MSDLISIRKSEENFETWRNSFQKVLFGIKDLKVDSTIDEQFEISSVANRILSEEAKSLRSSIKASSLKSKLTQSFITLIIGGTAAYINKPETFIGVASGVAGGFLGSLLFLRRKKEKDLLKFYTLFKGNE